MCSPFPRDRTPATAGFCPRASPESPFPFRIQPSCAQPTRSWPAYQPISASLLRSRFRRSRPNRGHKAAFSAYSPGLFSRWQQFFICLHSGRIAAQTRISPPEMVIRFPFTRASAICWRACSYILATVDLEILILSAHCFWDSSS